jgi:hypothetical protein
MCKLGATFVQLESLEHRQFVAEDKLKVSRKYVRDAFRLRISELFDDDIRCKISVDFQKKETKYRTLLYK